MTEQYSQPRPMTLTEWDKLGTILDAMAAHRRRLERQGQISSTVGEAAIRDGTSPEELDEFLEQQRTDQENTEE